MKITKLMLVLFALFIFDNIGYRGLGKHTYKSWSLQRILLNSSKRKSMILVMRIYKFIKDKKDIVASVIISMIFLIKNNLKIKTNPLRTNCDFVRICI